MKSEKGLQQAKSDRAREAICTATIDSLVDVGYSETSLNRVAGAAGFSKGALQHHFPTKEDLIAATVDVLLQRTVKPQPSRKRPHTVEQSLTNAWTKFINTPAYRALMEVLNATRTDRDLQKRLDGELLNWGRKLDQQAVLNYEALSGEESDVVMLLNMSRSFMRGLLIQERYGAGSEETTQYVNKWIELVAPLLKLKSCD